MNKPLDKCPHCGAEKDAFLRELLPDQLDYECGTWKTTTLTHRTNLCIVREARQKVKVELAAAQKVINQYLEIAEELIDQGHFDRCEYLNYVRGKCDCGIGKLEQLFRQNYKA